MAAPACSTAATTSSSRFEPPGWTIAAIARLERDLRAVGEREERVGGEHRAAQIVTVLARLLDGDPNGVDPAHLARADADRRHVLRDHDRVRRHVL